MTPPPGPTSSETGAAASRRIVIVGAGIAGVSAAEAARQADPGARITLVSDEADLPYYRLNLTKYVAGEVGRDDLPLHPRSWYEERAIALRLGVRVTAIAPDGGTAAIDGGGSLPFDRLVLATGARPAVPPIEGTDLDGVTCLRTRADAERVLAGPPGDGSLADRPCVVIGGGLLGLETAAALRRHGARVTVVEGLAYLMPLQLTPEAAEVLQGHIEGMGIAVRTGTMTASLAGEGRVREAVMADGSRLAADLVVINTGVAANVALAEEAGLETRDGVVVDDRLATSHPHVFAAGDGAEHAGTLYGLWLASRVQGRTAGRAAAGEEDATFTGIPPAYILKVVDVDVFSIGTVAPEDPACQVVEGRTDGTYRRFVFRDGRLVGAILLGDTSAMPAARKAIGEGTDLSGLVDQSLSAEDLARGLAEAV
ncbi:MAG: FAD-dependent oxidoreductase [Phycisphaerae bacterium]